MLLARNLDDQSVLNYWVFGHLSFSIIHREERREFCERCCLSGYSGRALPNYSLYPSHELVLCLKQVEESYISDAYHSLSIEGYQVNPDLIEKVRSAQWNPDATEQARNQRNALAARGYWQAFQSVEKSLIKVLNGENPEK